MWNIALQAFKQRRTSLIIFCIGMGLFMLLYVAIYPTILEQADELEQLIAAYPQAFLQAFGIENFSFDTLEKFLDVEYYSAIWPLAVIILIVGTASRSIAGEIEEGTAELLLAKPVNRTKVFLGKVIGGVAIFSIFTLVSVVAAFPAAWVFDIEIQTAPHFVILGASMLFAFAVYGFSMLTSAIFSEKGKASLLAGGAMLSMYVLNLVASLVEDIEWLQYISFFHYYDHEAALLDSVVEPISVVALLGAGVVSLALAAVIFNKRDIS